jgi:putative intracellular protease/amidase
MKLTGKRAAIIVAQEYEDIELLYPILRLSEEGAEIVVAAMPIGTHPRPWIENKPVTGRFGHPVPIPVMPPGPRYRMVTLDELSAENVDCLLFPSGFAPDPGVDARVSRRGQDRGRHLSRAVGADFGRRGAWPASHRRARGAR